jgi:hypothetical protein
VRLFRSFLAVFVLLSPAACEKAGQPPAPAGARQDREAPATDRDKIAELSAELERLRIENRDLAARNEELALQNKEAGPRIQQLISGYGTGIWDYGDDDVYPVFMKPMKGAGFKEIIAELNSRFRKEGGPEIRFEKKDRGTVYLTISDEEMLGERMGSQGALSYMAAVTYSLTSVQGVDCVFFAIGQSDHAAPGKYCKKNLEPFLPQ